MTTLTLAGQSMTVAQAAGRPDEQPPADPGVIPLTVSAIKTLFNAVTARPVSLEHTVHWLAWRRRHQARARWFHHRARLSTAYTQLS
ncbi:hypothetical protein [Microbispora sp. H13382]|uniref:hypothetical protein n=1 Tax=Microbispora sp. H13382 TaxID=2729112 RepID=UPI001602C038|nr:hypothetical protein [Microbispora sp. H13382]